MKRFSDETVLVTGGAGFIGAHVSEHLLRQGYAVVVLDDLSGGFRENVPPGAEFVEGSILDHELLGRLFKRYAFSYVFHLAAYAAEGLSHFIKRFNYTNNVVGSVNLINEAVKARVKCFVFTSSIAVYGAGQLPMTEDMLPMPEDSYGIAKWTVEQELKASQRMFGLKHIIFRPHNVYGEKQNIGDKYRNVIGIFMNRIMRGEPLPVFGDGEQTRAFSHIDDVAPVIAESIGDQACYGETFNVGAAQFYSINELADVVMEAMGQYVEKQYLPAREEVLHAYSDHTKIARFFRVPEPVTLRDGICRMAAWARAAGARESTHFDQIEIEQNLPASWRRDAGRSATGPSPTVEAERTVTPS